MIKDYLTYIKESVTEEFKIGDEVFVNGDVDGKNFHGDTDFISDIGKIMVYTNMNEKGKCPSYSYIGKSFYLSKSHWWVSPFNLNRAPNRERIITANDPYGEEIQESVNEAVKKDRGDLYSIDKVLRAVPLSINDLMGHRDTEDKRNLILNYLNRLKGKKIVFYNHKEGRNIKKERIMDDAHWARVPGDYVLLITGTKKDYVVNRGLPIGFYMEGGPKRNICPLDPYGEEDWEN